MTGEKMKKKISKKPTGIMHLPKKSGTVIFYQNRTSPFSPTCTKIMDLFLSYPTIYFTPKTASMSLDDARYHTVKTCMSLLLSNSYLSKNSMNENTYYITKENMEFWVTDFKNHINNLENIRAEKEMS